VKLALATIWFVIVIAIAMGGSCSVNHPSAQFDCEKQSDCPTGRVCSDNLCVVTGSGSDAGGDGKDAGHPDALACPTTCTSCVLETMSCKIDCAISPATCNSQVVCPEGWNCDIVCSPGNSCRNGVDCQAGKSCIIECKGASSCRNIACGEGPCDVICSGVGSCRNISCGNSCKCDVDCQVNSLCDTVVCTSPNCDAGFGCSSLFPGCTTTCP